MQGPSNAGGDSSVSAPGEGTHLILKEKNLDNTNAMVYILVI